MIRHGRKEKDLQVIARKLVQTKEHSGEGG